MSLISTVTVTRSVSPIGARLLPQLLGQAAGQQPGQRLALLLPVDDRLVQQPEPLERALRGRPTRLPPASGTPPRPRRRPPRAAAFRGRGDRLDRLALGDHAEQFLLGREQAARRDDRLQQRLDDRRVERGAAGGHAADRVGQLAALGHAVLEQVAVARRALGQQRDRVLGVVELRQHHDAGARVPLAHLLGRVDALAAERRRHPDVGDQHLRRVPRRSPRPPRRSRRPRR